MVKSSSKLSKGARPLSSKFDQEKKVDSNKVFGEDQYMKDEALDTFGDSFRVGKNYEIGPSS